MYFNKNLKYLMKINNMSQSDLARKLDTSRQNINQIMNTEIPKVQTLIKLKEFFNISIDDLLLKDLSNEQKEEQQ